MKEGSESHVIGSPYHISSEHYNFAIISDWFKVTRKIILQLKFIYSEKATKFCEISSLLLSYVVPAKSKVEILQNFVTFSEYMNFKKPLKKMV